MVNVIVTGGTGFCGYWMKQTEPESVEAVYLSKIAYTEIGWYDWDGCDIVHLAPVSPNWAIRSARDNNKRLLYASSGIVYHPENTNEYRLNKIRWERECLDSGADVVIARLFTFYGERLDDNKAIVQFERAAKAGEPLRIWGDGSCVRSYMSGEEMGRRLWAVLLKGASGESYDIGSTVPVTMLELARRYSDNIIIEGGHDAMPIYLPVDAEKTERLLDE
jgi:nucleoside-diphosphate-sugar epimerase